MNPAWQADDSALAAPGHWQTIDFISDLHLHSADDGTFDAWQHYMAHSPADAMFILGDLFEVWVGDDVVNNRPGQPAGFEARCQQVLAAAAKRLELFFMAGNRDFLLGPAFAQSCDMTLLPDPTPLAFDGQRWLLSHGDALCVNDTDYQQFRTTVRTDAWQNSFLARPLAERQTLARGLRAQSEARKAGGAVYADVDAPTAIDWLNAANASTLIHGHTHQPADHVLDDSHIPPLQRLVLSDWCATAAPPRLQVLRLHTGQPPVRVNLAATASA